MSDQFFKGHLVCTFIEINVTSSVILLVASMVAVANVITTFVYKSQFIHKYNIRKVEK